MAEPQTPTATEEKLYTLSEISQRTGISMPTLQRYKKSYQARIPSVGTGRKQRYPEHALPVFHELRTENASRRGRPRKDASAAGAAAPAARKRRTRRTVKKAPRGTTRRGAGRRRVGQSDVPDSLLTGRTARAAPGRRKAGRGRRPAAAAKTRAKGRRGRPPGRPPGRPARATRAAGVRGRRGPGRRRAAAPARKARVSRTAGLLTLTQISKTTGISYPTLVRYVRLYSRRLPHEGEGRARRFYPAAVSAFRTLRAESSRGGRRAGGRRVAGAAAGRRGGARRGRPPLAGTAARATNGRRRRRGRPPGSAGAAGDRRLAKRVTALEKSFGALIKRLQKLAR